MLSNNELCEINAGAAKWSIGLVVGAVVSFIVGVIDGFVRPLGCNGK